MYPYVYDMYVPRARGLRINSACPTPPDRSADVYSCLGRHATFFYSFHFFLSLTVTVYSYQVHDLASSLQHDTRGSPAPPHQHCTPCVSPRVLWSRHDACKRELHTYRYWIIKLSIRIVFFTCLAEVSAGVGMLDGSARLTVADVLKDYVWCKMTDIVCDNAWRQGAVSIAYTSECVRARGWSCFQGLNLLMTTSMLTMTWRTHWTYRYIEERQRQPIGAVSRNRSSLRQFRTMVQCLNCACSCRWAGLVCAVHRTESATWDAT